MGILEKIQFSKEFRWNLFNIFAFKNFSYRSSVFWFYHKRRMSNAYNHHGDRSSEFIDFINLLHIKSIFSCFKLFFIEVWTEKNLVCCIMCMIGKISNKNISIKLLVLFVFHQKFTLTISKVFSSSSIISLFLVVRHIFVLIFPCLFQKRFYPLYFFVSSKI
jgi:hypothetical protein